MGFVTVEETRHKRASSTNLKGIKNFSFSWQFKTFKLMENKIDMDKSV